MWKVDIYLETDSTFQGKREGGVAKTTSSINIAYTLQKEMNA